MPRKIANPAFDAYARPGKMPRSGDRRDPFAALRGELERLDAWDGSASTVPDAAACDRLESEIWQVVRRFRVKRNPTMQAAVLWLDRNHKSLGVGEILERCCRKWKKLCAGQPFLAQSSWHGERGRELLSIVSSLENLNPQRLMSYRAELRPGKGQSLLAAAWRHRAEYAEWRLGFKGRKVFVTGSGWRFAGCVDLGIAYTLALCGLIQLPLVDLPTIQRESLRKIMEREKKQRQRACQKKSSVT